MITLEEGLHGFLAQIDSAAAARVYPIILPQAPTLPALTYGRVSTVREYDHSGSAKLVDARVDVHCWGREYGTVKHLAQEVVLEIDGFRGDFIQDGQAVKVGKTMIQGEIDLYETDTKLHHTVIDLGLGYTE